MRPKLGPRFPTPASMSALSREFIAFAVACEAIRFGEFKTKAGRLSPYFLNTGQFNNGERIRKLAQFYAKAIVDSGLPFDMLFGAAYKGIPLVVGSAMGLAEAGRNVPFCFNRKEAKDHGEGGSTVGAPLVGKVLIVDDVISAGTAIRESVELIRSAGATPCGVVVSVDRMERGSGLLSATQEVAQSFGMPVVSIANLDDLIEFVRAQQSLAQYLRPINRYREQYGAKSNAS
jgi:orotate phosphoribosyltransferase